MRIFKYALICTFFCAANSFAEPIPVPASKAAYIGTWKSKAMDLTIAADGKVQYKRVDPNKNVNLSIELARFNGDNFEAGVGIIVSTFVVSMPPTSYGDKTKMVVDGVELTKME